MNLTYRQKRLLKKALKWCGILLGVFVAAIVLFLIFVERYVVYTKDGVRIDYNHSAAQLQATEPVAPTQSQSMDVNIVYESPQPSADEDVRISGYMLTAENLADAANLLDWAAELEKGSTVLMELKGPDGLLCYNSNLVNARRSSIDTDAVEQLIIALRKNGCTPVALLSAFADDAYADSHPDAALSTADGSFWIGAHNAYWLNPTDDAVTTYLEQIASELANKGFTEVVYADYAFPESEAIDFESDESRTELLVSQANRLIDHFDGTNMAVSFLITEPDFPVECLRSKLYVRNAEASSIDYFVSSYQSEDWDARKNMIFITSSRDSRFQDFGVLAPVY